MASLCAIVAIAYIMVYRHELRHGIAARLNMRREAIPPLRGEIFDRNMRPLVLHTQMKSLYTVYDGTVDNELADKAAHVLGTDPVKMRNRLKQKSRFIWVARKIDEDKAQKIREIDVNHRFEIRYEPAREYPRGKTFARHLLGFTNIDNDGMEGLELLYNDVLAGRDAGMRYLFGNHRYEFPPKQQGENLILNLDAELEWTLKQQIDDGWVKMKRPSIIAIAMDAERGEILASVVRPGRGKYRRAARNNAATERDNGRERLPINRYAWAKYGSRGFFSKIRNRAVTDMFEPGNDVASLFINAAALEEGIITENAVANAATTPEGLLARLGEERLHDYMRAFGFGSKTGIDLPGEIGGVVRNPEFYRTNTRGPGYCMAVTPVQLLSAFCALANDGILMIPHVVSKTVSSDNKVISTYQPHIRARPLSGETADALLSLITKHSAVDGCNGIIPMISGTAARYESRYAPGEATLFTLAFVGRSHKVGVLLIVDNPSDVDQAKKFSEDVMRIIAWYRLHGRDALHASDHP